MRISDWSSDVCSSDVVIALVPAVAGALIVAGVIGLVVGLKPAPVRPPRSRPVQRKPMSAGMKRLLLVGVIGGCMAWLVTGWALALVAVPLALDRKSGVLGKGWAGRFDLGGWRI